MLSPSLLLLCTLQREAYKSTVALQFAIYAAYAGRLETAFLTDELASAKSALQGNAPLHKPPMSNVGAASAPVLDQPSVKVHLPACCCLTPVC